ncbi:hypothetical protein [Flavobacterium sp.]|uniref:hypothetical protein n=1 Tax=Flavobacterium sp. TaxID=239 RepID=UPI0025FA1E71|nr:hypothetical protein [Flavobacterium sp.]
MKLIIIFLFSTFITYSQNQNFEIKDTIEVNKVKLPTYFFNVEKNSHSNPAMVFIVNSKDFEKIKKLIPKLYFSRKQEYTDFYVLSVKSLNDIGAVKSYLNEIDLDRMKRQKSTFLRIYEFDKNHQKITYTSLFKTFTETIDNVYYLKSVEELCKYMVCRIR